MTKSLLIYNARLLDESMDTPGAILSIDGKIRSVFQGYFTNSATASSMAKAVLLEDGYGEDCTLELFDASGLTLTPAFIDMHVHLRYPGQTQKEDLNSGMRAASAGGFGTICAMPNTNPVVSSKELAEQIQKEATALNLGNMFQVVSITDGFKGESTDHLYQLDPSTTPMISEDGREVASASTMLSGMLIAAQKNMVVACHCEDPTLAQEAKTFRQKALELMKENGIPAWRFKKEDEENVKQEVLEEIQANFDTANGCLRLAEDIATERNISLASAAGCRLHLCHVSTIRSIELARQAKARGAKITCEVTPHHIGMNSEDITMCRALVNPPLRTAHDQEAVISGIFDGTVDCISTDHAPHTMEDKAAGSPGFVGLETAYGVCNTMLVKNNGLDPKKLSKLMSANPARILGLNKGLLSPKYDSDFTIVDPDDEWIVDPERFLSKGKSSTFDGQKLKGRVRAMFIGGKVVYEN